MSFREAFKHSNAVKSLQMLQVYEGAGSIFWFDAKKPSEWKGVSLGGSSISLAQLIAARSLFTKDQLIASNPDTEFVRCLAFPIFLPSAVGDLTSLGGSSISLAQLIAARAF